MKRLALPVILFACLSWAMQLHAANETPSQPKKQAPTKVVLPEGVTEEMLAPPPVPRFMLEKPAKPLSNEEMVEQAREAERKAAGAVKKHAPKP